MIKNLFLLSSLFGIGVLSAMDSGLNKSTLNQCTNNNSNTACEYLLVNGTDFQKSIARKTLLIRGL
tara:strand:+ start:870 stop:1067 length:198 start_codon:yes stop_codon:yes gene_type:complete